MSWAADGRLPLTGPRRLEFRHHRMPRRVTTAATSPAAPSRKTTPAREPKRQAEPGKAARGWSAPATAARAKPPKGAPPELTRAAASLEAAGGSVRWFSSRVLDDGPVQHFFAVQRLPTRADPSSAVFQLRTEAGRAYLASLHAAGAPIAFGQVPESLVGVQAMALGKESALGGAIVAATGSKQDAAIFLQPHAGALTVAHEFQHWQDFTDPAYERRLQAAFAKLPGLRADEADFLRSVVDELRGHNGEAQAADGFAARGMPFVNRAGASEPGTKERYEGEKAMIRNKFVGAYGREIRRIVARLRESDPATLKALARELKALDLSERPGAVLSFARFTGSGPA